MSETQNKMNAGAGSADSKLREFFLEELKDIYYAEKQIAKILPKMKSAATAEELKTAFEEHRVMTLEQIKRLERVFELMEKEPEGKVCNAIEGIIKEGEEIIDDTDEGTATRDVGLILAAQKVEHYEMSTYGGLAQLATTLGEEEVASLLYQTLTEETETDDLLTEIAENNVNYEAAAE